MLMSDPIVGIDRFDVVIDEAKHEIPPMGINMLMVDLESLEPGVHSFTVTPFVDELALEPISFQLVIEERKKGTAYILMVDETNKKFFEEPLSLFIKNGAGGGGGGGKCFISGVMP